MIISHRAFFIMSTRSSSTSRLIGLGLLILISSNPCFSQTPAGQSHEKAAAIIGRAIERLGGERYLQVRSQISRGKFSIMKAGALISFQTFFDVIVFPDRE